jgi:hypothetical protein
VSVDQIQNHLLQPLLAQVRIDAGEAVADLAAGRLTPDGQSQTVRDQSHQLGVTRARVYQLLDECARIMAVRWPEGRVRLRLFEEHLVKIAATGAATQVGHIREFFFPAEFALNEAPK